MDVQITIPQLYDGTTFYKLYVYCSSDAQDIDTITKIRTIQPNIIIDEAAFDRTSQYFQVVNGRECYVIPANVLQNRELNIDGVSWYDKDINFLPVSEYETVVDMIEINPFTYVNKVTLNNIYTSELGSMLYYSVIGVNSDTNQVTHLSKVSGVRIKLDLSQYAKKLVTYCNNYTGNKEDLWEIISAVNWDTPIVIGDIKDDESYKKFGCPFVTKIQTFKKDDVIVSLKPLNTIGCILLSFPNPWQYNNRLYNYRKLKSFRIVNISGKSRSKPSEPTFQSLLPLSIEKVRILILPNATNANSDIPYNLSDDPESKVIVKEVVRKNGMFYDTAKHMKLGLNKFNIPFTENTAIFSETSTQDKINMEIDADLGTTYKITIYLIDAYQNISNPVTTFVYV